MKVSLWLTGLKVPSNKQVNNSLTKDHKTFEAYARQNVFKGLCFKKQKTNKQKQPQNKPKKKHKVKNTNDQTTSGH